MHKIFDLNSNWEFSLQSRLKYLKDNKWFKAEIPGTVYHNLLSNNLIPDPFYADNELRLQGIAESDWSYRTTFNYPEEFDQGKPVTLVFDGLDTIADIILNDKKIGTSENMFRRYEIDVTGLLKKKNTLRVNFFSPYTYARKEESKYGKLPVALNSERVYIRKAQYSFGWDWGPSFADIGIWKPVFLIQREEAYIRNFTFSTTFINNEKAEAELKINFNTNLSPVHHVKINISDDKSSNDFNILHNSRNFITETLEIPYPKLWWPNGEGDQHLYKIKIILEKDGDILDEVIKSIGIRIIELRLKEEGENTFYFKVNSKRIFAKGTNWIPADSFLTRVDKAEYQRLLSLAKDAHMNIIRVWGGGIYEQDMFYELCDQLGLLVWQDFLFACASYPEHKEFLENVTAEVEENVYRLQYHASIAIWCGNNENEWIWYQSQKKSYKEMPGYKIFSSIIPGILQNIDPHRAYWESSPFGHEEDPNSALSGNRHQWNLWSNWKDYNEVINDNSLFVTEFGFQGPANHSTLEKVIPPGERNPHSYLFEFHNKQVEGNERMFKFLAGHLPVRTEWNDFIYLAQLNQGLALKTCLDHWRFNYPYTNGSVIWQLNDCWPVSSWAIIDSDNKPKLAYYFVKNSFNTRILKFIYVNNEIDLYLLNDRNIFSGYAEITGIDLLKDKFTSKKIKIKSDAVKSKVHSLKMTDNMLSGQVILYGTIYNEKKEIIYRTVFSIPEWKYLRLPKARIKAKIIKKKKDYFISLRTNKPALFVTVYADGVTLSLNGLNILPGEEFLVPAEMHKSPDKIKLHIFSLNDYLS